MPKNQLSAILWLTVIFLGALLVTQGAITSSVFLKPCSMAIGGVLFVVGAFEKWLWRIPLLYGWFVQVPNLQGTWSGTLVSDWKDPKTGAGIAPINAYLVIRQTLTTIDVRLMTEQSASVSLAGALTRDQAGVHRFVSVYANEPKLEHRARSPIHYGAFLLDVAGHKPKLLEGEYWTDRNTKGTMNFRHSSRQAYHSYLTALKAIGVPTSDSTPSDGAQS